MSDAPRALPETTPQTSAGAIHVAPLSAVQKVARRLPSYDLLTLLSPDADASALATLAPQRRLHLTFHDIAAPRDGLIAPDTAMTAALLEFGRACVAPLLIHCWAGISRSSAAAYILACDARPGREHELAAALREQAPFATPNPLMVRLADDLLERHGAMIDAIAGIGRGAEAFEGTPYRLDAR